jgi:predicted lactoylglutathione lyase
MDLTAFMKKYADEIGGQFTEYDQTQSIVIVPVSGNRYQTVIGNIRQNELYNRRLISFTSKVSALQSTIDFKMLLEQSAYFNYCRFVIKENYLQVEASTALDSATESVIKEMVQEVANLGDQFELKLTDSDIH